MEETLIGFETSKLAKEKGFDIYQPTQYSQRVNPTTKYNYSLNQWKLFGNELYAAPTQSLLQRWLREEHFLYVEPKRSHFDGYLGIAVFKCNVVDGNYDDVKGKSYIIRTEEHMLDFNTYEDALEMGLFRALQFIGVGTIKNY